MSSRGLTIRKAIGQDVPHEVDLAALPGRSQPLLADRDLDPAWASEMQSAVLFMPLALSFRKKTRHESSDSSNTGSTARSLENRQD